MEHSDSLYKDNGVGGVMLRLVGWQPQLSAGFEHTLYVPSCAYMHALLVSLPRIRLLRTLRYIRCSLAFYNRKT